MEKRPCAECKRTFKRYRLIQIKGGACAEFVCYRCADRFDYDEIMPSVAEALRGTRDEHQE